MKKDLKTLFLLSLPIVILVAVAIQLRAPNLEIVKTEVVPLSAAEQREFKGADTGVQVEVKHNDSLFSRPFSAGKVTGGTSTYLEDHLGRRYTWSNVVTSFRSRNHNFLVTYPVPLHIVPPTAGRVTLHTKFTYDKAWQELPISVVVRP